jgi:hypothetical protein
MLQEQAEQGVSLLDGLTTCSIIISGYLYCAGPKSAS